MSANEFEPTELPMPYAQRVFVGYGVRAAQASRDNGAPTAFIGCKDGSITRVPVTGEPRPPNLRREGKLPLAKGGRYCHGRRTANGGISTLCPVSDSEVLVGCADGSAEVWTFEAPPADADRRALEARVAPVELLAPDREGVPLSLIGRLASSPDTSYYLVAWRRGPLSVYAVDRSDSGRWEPIYTSEREVHGVILARRISSKAWLMVTKTGQLAVLSCRNEPEDGEPSPWKLKPFGSDVYISGPPPILVRDYAGARFQDEQPSPPRWHDTMLLATDTGIWRVECSYPDALHAFPLHLPGFAGTCNALALQRDNDDKYGWILFANDEHARAHIFRRSGMDWRAQYTTNEHDIHVVRALGFPSRHGIDIVLAGHNSEARLMHYPLPSPC